MTIRELFEDLTARGVILTRNDNRLHVEAPTGALPQTLRAELAARRDEMLAWVDVETTLRAHLHHLATSPELPEVYRERGRRMGHEKL